jgi:hypothetical protein
MGLGKQKVAFWKRSKMNRILISLFLVLGFSISGKTQISSNDGLYYNRGGRQVWIVGTDGQKTLRGLLYKVSRDSVYYVETHFKTITPQTSSLELKRLHYSQIDTLVTLKNKPGAKGAVAGGLVGFAAGIAIRAATYDPDPITQVVVILTGGEGPYYFGAGLLGAGVGVAAGAGIGSIAKKKWIIKGQESNYQNIILELDKRAYWNRFNRPKTGYNTNPKHL